MGVSMHISFTVPMWALIGFGTVAYPSIGALIGSFLMRASSRRLHGGIVAVASTLWPVTLGLGVAGFPFWLAAWFMKNYGAAIASVLSRGGKGALASVMEAYNLHDRVSFARSFGHFSAGSVGTVVDQKGNEVQVSVNGIGSSWVPNDVLRRA
jgi:hypothetical protein